MEKRNPPSYTSFASGASMRPTAAEADALLNHLAERADEQYMLDEEYLIGAEVLLKRETEPIRNMLEFTLSMDYQCYSAASISTSDREHFIHMAEASRQLRTTLGQPTGPRTAEVRPTPEERQVLAAYFWKYLHEPCKALSLPLDCVYNDIVHLGRYTHEHGGYKGSVFGILQQYGVMRLASKLYMDREFLIPRVFSD
ncbi:unnamed protein product [Zymoseptoria tritici ST99CH_1A5]|uniref:Uncharacterized protein n=2 Tax=Zymoseptoria tritici TaxID=1047171 RepID=A0A2H1FY55_ZYMTR|nr:unnamed protein product [Zymoseptoria tritici ST99CH_1E4]SMR47511.1 unnamed protein product [Zymoseptoria tritici ST99CH_3D1]SMY21411.1 unnamed protein product [Zymoseptoria tritici ST99CH_1A5]